MAQERKKSKLPEINIKIHDDCPISEFQLILGTSDRSWLIDLSPFLTKEQTILISGESIEDAINDLLATGIAVTLQAKKLQI